MKNKNNQILPSSFRDPSGFVFIKDNKIYRQINKIYQVDYDYLMESGLYESLLKENLVIKHEEVSLRDFKQSDDAYKIISPQEIPFFSYPYEWSFSRFKQAALATLQIQKIALTHNMILKDASAYNIQFYENKPLLIDTLSFKKYKPNTPWIAYRQFCQHFLAPLALMSMVDIRLQNLLREYIDGIPLDLASKLLPVKSKLSFSLLSHIHLHAKTQKHYSEKFSKQKNIKISKQALLSILDNLANTIKNLQWKISRSEWSNYYQETNYSDESFNKKKEVFISFVDSIDEKLITAWDLGANTGEFSRILSKQDIFTVAFDFDFEAVEINSREVVKNNNKNLLPLVLDITNPSPALGWAHAERESLLERGPADLVLALALMHHLSISNNIPFLKLADFFQQIGKWLIIEYVPKSDSNAQKLLWNREDIFSDYSQENFEKAMSTHFDILKSGVISESKRVLYLMRNKNAK